MIKITIDTENAAFHDPDNAGSDDYIKHHEISRILNRLARIIEGSCGDIGKGALLDSNGNKVGECVEVHEE